MRIGAKSPVLASSDVAFILDRLSKAALIDLVVDLFNRMHGEDVMGDDEKLLEAFTDAFGPVARVRGDKVPDLFRLLNGKWRQEDAYAKSKGYADRKEMRRAMEASAVQ
jgi:hypothetical protein